MAYSKYPQDILNLAPEELLVLLKEKMLKEQNLETKFLLKAATLQLEKQFFKSSETVTVSNSIEFELDEAKETDLIVTTNDIEVIKEVKKNLSNSVALISSNSICISTRKKRRKRLKGLNAILDLMCQMKDEMRRIPEFSEPFTIPRKEEKTGNKVHFSVFGSNMQPGGFMRKEADDQTNIAKTGCDDQVIIPVLKIDEPTLKAVVKHARDLEFKPHFYCRCGRQYASRAELDIHLKENSTIYANFSVTDTKYQNKTQTIFGNVNPGQNTEAYIKDK